MSCLYPSKGVLRIHKYNIHFLHTCCIQYTYILPLSGDSYNMELYFIFQQLPDAKSMTHHFSQIPINGHWPCVWVSCSLG